MLSITSRKYIHVHLTEFTKGWGISKARIFLGKYKAKFKKVNLGRGPKLQQKGLLSG